MSLAADSIALAPRRRGRAAGQPAHSCSRKLLVCRAEPVLRQHETGWLEWLRIWDARVVASGAPTVRAVIMPGNSGVGQIIPLPANFWLCEVAGHPGSAGIGGTPPRSRCGANFLVRCLCRLCCSIRTTGSASSIRRRNSSSAFQHPAQLRPFWIRQLRAVVRKRLAARESIFKIASYAVRPLRGRQNTFCLHICLVGPDQNQTTLRVLYNPRRWGFLFH